MVMATATGNSTKVKMHVSLCDRTHWNRIPDKSGRDEFGSRSPGERILKPVPEGGSIEGVMSAE